MDLSFLGRHFGPYLVFYFKILSLIFFGLSNSYTGLCYPAPVDIDGTPLRWNIQPENPEITYTVTSQSDDIIATFSDTIDASALLWSQVPTSFLRLIKHDENIHLFKPHITLELVSSIAGDSFSAGYAVFDEFSTDGPIHCTIKVLVTDSLSFRSVAKTILHELGHCLGLGHSLIPEAIMSYQLDKNRYSLDIDDKAALSRLYPLGKSHAELPPGCAIQKHSLVENRDSPRKAYILWFLFTFPVMLLSLKTDKFLVSLVRIIRFSFSLL